jgi:hypothetical protein
VVAPRSIVIVLVCPYFAAECSAEVAGQIRSRLGTASDEWRAAGSEELRLEPELFDDFLQRRNDFVAIDALKT